MVITLARRTGAARALDRTANIGAQMRALRR
jgi:hypothetical protein